MEKIKEIKDKLMQIVNTSDCGRAIVNASDSLILIKKMEGKK